MRKKYFLLLVFLFFYWPALSNDKMYFNFDYAVFKGEDNLSILEVYYSVNQNSLKYVKTQNAYEAAVKISLSITEVSSNKEIFSKIYKTPSIVSDTLGDVLKQKLVGQINYSLPDGNYKIKIIGSDLNEPSQEDFFEKEITIVNNGLSKITISDIELSTLIRKTTDDKSIFYKNTLEVIPNPSNLFGMNLKDLYYYFEVYGLTAENISENYSLTYEVSNLKNEILISATKNIKRNAEAKADFGKLRIDSLKRGSYIFKVTLTDSAKNISISNEKKFYIFTTQENVLSLNNPDNFLKSEYAAMSEEMINDEIEKIQYIMSEEELDRFENLRLLDDKRKFLYTFWKSKDNNSGTSIVEYKIAFLKRVNEANKYYKEPYKEGWKTDRGRIFILYGKPDEVEIFPFQAATKSYEIWKYNTVEGGGECVFIERQPGTDVYSIVHSTFRNELRNDNWPIELRQ